MAFPINTDIVPNQHIDPDWQAISEQKDINKADFLITNMIHAISGL